MKTILAFTVLVTIVFGAVGLATTALFDATMKHMELVTHYQTR